MRGTDISIVIPAYNEEENVEALYKAITKVMDRVSYNHEIIFVNDGSSDSTFYKLIGLHKNDKRVKIINFTKNFGQTAAWDAGIKNSEGKYIITMDADLQNDPADIPRLLKKMEYGYDAVSGWRVNRKDNFSKKIFSFFANKLRRTLLKEKIHDSGCSLKIYKNECFDNIDLRGEMHRYITGILSLNGYSVGEIKVKHHPRNKGKTKYGTKRLLKGFLDLIMISFLARYSSRPLHIFGTLGLLSFLAGFITGGYLTFMKIFYGMSLSNRPLLILAVLLVIVGTQFIIFGIIADILMKIYDNITEKKPYKIKEIIR